MRFVFGNEIRRIAAVRTFEPKVSVYIRLHGRKSNLGLLWVDFASRALTIKQRRRRISAANDEFTRLRCLFVKGSRLNGLLYAFTLIIRQRDFAQRRIFLKGIG